MGNHSESGEPLANDEAGADHPTGGPHADAGGNGDRDVPGRVAVAPDDEPIGHGRPPRRTQFKPGQSGNPRGRPRGSRGLRHELKSELEERVTVTIDGRRHHIPKLRLIIKALAAKAAKGDTKAAEKLLNLVIQAEGFEDQRPQRRVLNQTEQRILDRLNSFHDEPQSDSSGSPITQANGDTGTSATDTDGCARDDTADGQGGQ